MPSSGQSLIPDFGDHFGDKSNIPENAIIISITLLGGEICRMYLIFPCDVTTSRARVYKRRQLNGGMTLEFRLQGELSATESVITSELLSVYVDNLYSSYCTCYLYFVFP
ncbi:hypothetical protein AVEN_135579-1 [Araneus ventricosus]|uniref:Uncharacterized protein n=1 Tax=Araneus ventricosus TaxID=182803 RepID=A0A4Y2VDQ3_ARAVE|nr:hypothetical protein AVEN_135579-1 [Araneus ventricosus]